MLLLAVGRLVLADGSRIGLATVVRGVSRVDLGPRASIGPSNWISSAPIPGATSSTAGCLVLGEAATVSTRHRLDCSGGITLHDGAALAGWETLVITHDLNTATGELRADDVIIGTNSFVHAGNKISAGTRLPPEVRTEVGAVLGPAQRKAGQIYAGNPAVAVGPFHRVRPECELTDDVVHVLPTVDDAYGGPGPVLAAWLELADGARRPAVFATMTVRGSLADRLDKVSDVDFVAPGAVLGRFYGNARQLRRIARAAATADLVVSHSFFHIPGLVAAWSARRHGVAWVIAPHGSLDPWDVTRHHRTVKYRLARLWRRRLSAATAWCVSEREAAELETFGAKPPSVVIPCPIGEVTKVDRVTAIGRLGELGQELSEVLDRGGQIVSFVGRFDVKKGIARLIGAFDEAASSRDVLVIAGRGDDEWQHIVTDSVARARRSTQILLPGWLDPTDKQALWSLPGIFALTSDNENFGVAVAEAMSAARPVLITDRVALADLVRDTGAGIVCSAEHDEVVRGLRDLLQDPAGAARMGAAGAQAVRRHLSPEAVHSRYADAVSAGVIATRRI